MATAIRKNRDEPYTTSPERNLGSVGGNHVWAGDFALGMAVMVELWGSNGELERSRLEASAPTRPFSLTGLSRAYTAAQQALHVKINFNAGDFCCELSTQSKLG